MLTLSTVIELDPEDIAPIYNFLLFCNDNQYQKWWPGIHLAFHTVRGNPGEVGSEIYMDEIVGSTRIRGNAVIVRADKNKEICWQVKKVILLPIWLTIKFESYDKNAILRHTLSVGFYGIGKILDSIICFSVHKHFESELAIHAKTEFPLLAKQLREQG